MSCKYSMLLAPLQVRGKTLKNRMLSSKCALQCFTTEQAIEFYTGLARNGAATVIVAMGNHPERDLNETPSPFSAMAGTVLDMRDPEVRAGFRRLTEAVHAEGTLVSASMMDIEPLDVNISDTPNWDEIPKNGDYNSAFFHNKPGISRERLERLIDEFVFRAKEAKDLGFDMCSFYMSYRSSILACSMSPLLNQRTDEYGGKTMAERATLARKIFSKIKEVCGEDFLIEAQISGIEEEPGYTLEGFLDYCQALEGVLDIVEIRGVDGSATHVNGLNLGSDRRPSTIEYAAAFKARNMKILCSPVGGYGNPEVMEELLQQGKSDLFSMARQFLADEHYYEKLRAGKPYSEIVPCILCNGCHGLHTCAVNPRLGRIQGLFSEKAVPKKVAVVGAGPGGMMAALTAAKRGHSVTLYEKADCLGGQLRAASVPDYKWPLGAYVDYLTRELEKTDVVIQTRTEVTAELLKAEQYDAILWAAGSEPLRPSVDGAESAWLAEDVFGHEEMLGKNVVVIGGADTGRDVSLYLARAGHNVTLVTRHQIQLSSDMHTERVERESFEILPNFSYVDFAATEKIEPNVVTLKVQTNPTPGFLSGMKPLAGEDLKYGFPKDAPGPEGPGGPGGPGGLGGPGHRPMGQAPAPVYKTRILTCDSVVVSGGRTPRDPGAIAACAPIFKKIGDSVNVADIPPATYSGYKAAMEL